MTVLHINQSQSVMPQNIETFIVSIHHQYSTFSAKSLITVQKYVWTFQQSYYSWFLLTCTTFLTCFGEYSLFFQPGSLFSSYSWPAVSNADCLCPQTTVDRAMVGSESILQDFVPIHTCIGLSVMPKNLDVTLVFFPHKLYMAIFLTNVFDITNPTWYFFRHNWRPINFRRLQIQAIILSGKWIKEDKDLKM